MKQQELNTSSGWFHWGKQWHSFHNLKPGGVRGSTDEVAASKFLEQSQEIVEEGVYSLKYIPNFDEMQV
jgi:hypothetical protein